MADSRGGAVANARLPATHILVSLAVGGHLKRKSEVLDSGAQRHCDMSRL